MTSIERLFSYVCCGNLEKVKEYYDEGGKRNVRYNRFGKEHSLLIGAFNNRCYEMIDYLLRNGETLTDAEYDYFWEERERRRAIDLMLDFRKNR